MSMNNDWLNFWFKPQLFLHESWFERIDKRLLNKNSSALAWNLSYTYVCDALRLPHEYKAPATGLAWRIIKDLMQNDRSIVDLAAMMVCSVAVDNSMSTDLKRKILQRNRAMSLKKRFAEACEDLEGRNYGVYFIYLAIMLETPSLWPRVRLMFKKDVVEKIEKAGKKVPRSEANSKAVKRAWVEIYTLKGVIRPTVGDDPFIETVAPVQAKASNDDGSIKDGQKPMAAVAGKPHAHKPQEKAPLKQAS